MKKSALALLLVSILYSCDNQVIQYPVSYQNDDFMQRSQERGKALLQEEIQWFDDYQKKSDLKFNKTESGFWISNSGLKNNEMANVGDFIEFNYQVSTIDNQIIYPYSEIGTQKIIIGKADIPRGLQAALQLINPGEKVKILLPSFLGYGGFGDENKIDADQPIIMDVEVIRVNKK